ncbi:hypothetical protein ACIGHG_24160 [Bacillus sp. NPDC077411]|uniref:EamA domain-containing protein n=1 Tax=Bacillus bruguierae TaxID=3127667 RepID=A0ABU8FLL6_9BACI|nr:MULTISPECIES: hypothetical protein [unclassified Bacillus (in: firmicutes)]SFI69020.1 hypothetical protein SAMN04488574_10410 [Bacillus sp. 71mf]SFS90060.1 hypothetical protein SAMN04488145_104356 [Bacillus sp. 103mf]
MLLGVGLIILGILITSITTYYEIKKAGGISWLEVLVFPVGLIIGMIFNHFDLPEFLILLGLVCIVLGSVMVMGISII